MSLLDDIAADDPEFQERLKKERAKTRGKTTRPARAAKEGWEAGLIAGRNGDAAALLVNAVRALRTAPEWQGVVWHDAFRNQTTMRGRAPWMVDDLPDAPWNDRCDVLTACWLQEHSISVGDGIAGCAIATVAADNVFHPVLDYLSRCEWDGIPRLDGWLVDYLGVADSHYCRAVGARWMIAAVARVSEPGCKADCALILEGDQGTKKSTALRTISAPWFTDEISDLGTKDAAMQIAGAWIIELAELDSISRGDVSRIKAFMSRSTDRFRPPYGHHVIEQPRQCVFAGTANHNEYLRDETGGRRFWPVQCTTIRIDRLIKDRDQIWGEAVARYRGNEKWWLDTRTLTEAAENEQSGRYQSDAWQHEIERFIAAKPAVSVAEILRDAMNIPMEKWGQPEQNRVARCLRAAGWKRVQVRTDGKREWQYRPPSPLDRPAPV